MERYNESLEAYGKATTLDPSLDRIWYRQGHVLMLTERYEESLRSLEEARELNPSYSDALNDIELVQKELNRGSTDSNVEGANMAAEAQERFREDNRISSGWRRCCPMKQRISDVFFFIDPK